MKVSVIIPVYGVEKYLDKCVSSVISQTYSNLEIILVDDGGTDNCPDMCDAWAKRDSRVKVIHKSNEGQGVARNAALDIATGDYVLFVDSDDCILPKMVQSLVEATNNGEYDAAVCQYMVDNGVRNKKVMLYNEQKLISTQEAIYKYAVERTIFTGPVCKLFRINVFDEIRFPSFRAREDAYIMHRLLGKCNKIMLLPDCMYVVTLRSDSTEGRAFNKSRLHLLDCEEDLRRFIAVNYPQLVDKIQYRVAESILHLLKDIHRSKKASGYNEIENVLKSRLKEERNALNESNCPSKLLNEIDCYLDNCKKFIRLVRMQAFKRKIKSKIKMLVQMAKNEG